MKKFFYVIIALFVIIALPSCRGAAGKKAGEKALKLVEEYGGKFIKGAKKAEIHKYGDDVLKHITFVEYTCSECNGSGEALFGDCSECDGSGVVYKIEYR